MQIRLARLDTHLPSGTITPMPYTVPDRIRRRILATLFTGQGLISDPIDKATTFVIVYLITVAMAVRLKARFPQGEQLVEQPTSAEGREEAPAPGAMG